MIFRVLTLAALLIGAAAGPRGAGSAAPPPTAAERVAAAEQALARSDYGAALEAFQKAREIRPDAPELSYNMGVAAFKAGRLGEAADHFRDTLALTDDPALRSKTAYNLGTTAYVCALLDQGPMASPAPSGPAAPVGEDAPGKTLDDVTKELAEALSHYREALQRDPANTDARYNAELTQRLLTRLEEMAQQQQQQQPGESTENEENATDEQRAQQQQEQAGQQQDQQDQQEQAGQQQQDQQDQQEQTGQQQQEQQPEARAEAQEEQGGDEQEPKPDEGDSDGEDEQLTADQEQPETEAPPQRDERGGRGLSRAEAERLLQRVRDRERHRREELAKREAGKHPPVDKDW